MFDLRDDPTYVAEKAQQQRTYAHEYYVKNIDKIREYNKLPHVREKARVRGRIWMRNWRQTHPGEYRRSCGKYQHSDARRQANKAYAQRPEVKLRHRQYALDYIKRLKETLEGQAKLKAAKLKTRLKCQYGLTLERYDDLLQQQGGGCAICGTKPNGIRLYVDHEHRTDKLRGLLCSKCNLGLGHFEDSKTRLLKAVDYLERTK